MKGTRNREREREREQKNSPSLRPCSPHVFSAENNKLARSGRATPISRPLENSRSYQVIYDYFPTCRAPPLPPPQRPARLAPADRGSVLGIKIRAEKYLRRASIARTSGRRSSRGEPELRPPPRTRPGVSRKLYRGQLDGFSIRRTMPRTKFAASNANSETFLLRGSRPR